MSGLKLVKFIDYDANYAYSPPSKEASIRLDDIVKVIPITRENTRNPFDDIVRVTFRDGSTLDVIGQPRDFIEIKVSE